RADEDDAETGLPVREITAMDVVELGPVVNPAYPTTQASLRSIEEALCIGEFAPPNEVRDSQSVAAAPVSHLAARALVRALSK
ncbi:HK97 family phage prohead protease, partial [Streptomyces sp. NPDC050703]|uniref:HK97 family phage prohead protease n=1 Tax=Streptomyces sp. NPDC050703 TaxID=3157218 RepID=UPI003416FAAC